MNIFDCMLYSLGFTRPVDLPDLSPVGFIRPVSMLDFSDGAVDKYDVIRAAAGAVSARSASKKG